MDAPLPAANTIGLACLIAMISSDCQLGVRELREPLLRRGAWTVLRLDVDTPTELHERLAQVSWNEYAAERTRYEQRQKQFHRRYRWRHY